MGISKITVTEYICDGCDSQQFMTTDDPPVGITADWLEVTAGGFGGTLWICREQCLTKAFKRRYEIEREKEGR